MTVLDLGGTASAWRHAPVQPARVILWNTDAQETPEPWIEAFVKDACSPDDVPAVDLVYSNSVIEHVGGHWRQERLAETARSAGRYWVQTPNRYFPLEPHYLFPWLQHVPYALRGRLLAHWPLGPEAGITDTRDALRRVLSIDLLSLTELRFFFPEAEIYREKVFGLSKSFIAFRR